MESGERELRKAFEEVTTRNVVAAIGYGNETRKLTKELLDKVNQLEEQVRLQDKTINDLRLLLTNVQAKLYSRGSV